MSDPGQPDPRQWGPPQQRPPDGTWAGAPAQPSGSAGGHPGYPPPDQPPGQVAVPSWLASDWPLAAQIAVLGQLILLLGMALLTVVGVLRQMADIGLDRIDWAATSVRPLVELLGLSGAGDGEPLLLTGLLYSYLAYRVIARRHPRTLAMLAMDKPRTFAAGVKVGLVSAALLLVIAILLNSFADQLVLRSPSIAMTTSIDFTTLVFFTVFVGAVPAFLALLGGASLTLPRFLGLKPTSSAMLRGGMAGARRTLLVGGASLLALSTLGNLLDQFGASTRLGDVVGGLVGTIELLAVQWLDRAILLMLGAAKFLHDGGYLWYFGPQPEAWMWVALPVLAAAFVVGGIAAAKLAGPRTQAEAMRSSILVGPFVAAVSLLVAIGWAAQPFIVDIVPIAILLPSLWGILGVGGAWLWASQQGLPSGLVVGDAAQLGRSQSSPYPGGSGPASATNPPPAAPADGGWEPPPASPGESRPEPSPNSPSASPPGAAWGPPQASFPGESGPEPSPSSSSASPPGAAWGPPSVSSPRDAPEQAWPAPAEHEAVGPPAEQPGADAVEGTDDDIDLDALPPPGSPPDNR